MVLRARASDFVLLPALPATDASLSMGEEAAVMEVVHERCAGMDISKTDAKVCVRIAGAGRRKTVETVTTWGAMTGQVLALREHQADLQVTCVVMEATGDYWKPFYYLLDDLPGLQLLLVNARHVKNLPGRKTDVADAAWLAQLGAHGLVRGSFVPPAPIRELRDLTRSRTAITRERGREVQRLEKLLEDAGIKLSSVASDIVGVSGRAMLEAPIDGQRDPAALADLAKRRLRVKIPELTQALTGRFTAHHAFLARVHLDLIDQHTAAIDQLTARIDQAIEPFRGFRDRTDDDRVAVECPLDEEVDDWHDVLDTACRLTQVVVEPDLIPRSGAGQRREGFGDGPGDDDAVDGLAERAQVVDEQHAGWHACTVGLRQGRVPGYWRGRGRSEVPRVGAPWEGAAREERAAGGALVADDEEVPLPQAGHASTALTVLSGEISMRWSWNSSVTNADCRPWTPIIVTCRRARVSAT